ncbi:hypothetical protein OnM2_048026 [Erysiphe neolycopersici]|uniref:Uncharacterized protein n=1 Tax=Erysiphe neolycopersici TaxID=212602 RepID=A0A420HTG8_9PEZI|nr:hypothetical protein OnM2_048026 [Erysiphe neolycopersici]
MAAIMSISLYPYMDLQVAIPIRVVTVQIFQGLAVIPQPPARTVDDVLECLNTHKEQHGEIGLADSVKFVEGVLTHIESTH